METAVTSPQTQHPAELARSFELRLEKMKLHHDGLLAKAANGLSAELDNELQAAIIAFRSAKTDFQNKRKPITAEFDRIRKIFTEKESAIDTLEADLQTYRDQYAKKVAEENAAKQREAQMQMLKDQEAIDLRTSIELEIRAFVQAKIDTLKKGIIEASKTVTTENLPERLPRLQKMPIELNPDALAAFTSQSQSKYGHDIKRITSDVMEAISADLLTAYAAEIGQFKQEAIMHLNSIAKMDEKERKEALEKASQDAAIESASAMDIAKAQVEAHKEAETAAVAFNSITEADTIPENRSGFKIQIDERKQYAALAAYWFSVCFAGFSGDIEKKTIASMIKDLEKHAHDTGEKLASVRYEVVYKAVNRKS